jgi:hypothetical protein
MCIPHRFSGNYNNNQNDVHDGSKRRLNSGNVVHLSVQNPFVKAEN